MDKNKLISYSFFYEGDYNKIIRAIKDDKQLDNVKIDNCITIFDEEYPKRLFNLKYPPLVLYYKGDLSLLKEDSMAVVGSRLPCEYSLKATKGLVSHYKDKVIISDLAKGIDACAHEYAKKTIAVLGCGINYIYPICNKELYKRIEKEGLIISEYPDMVRPLAYHFPFRNRIIAGLSNSMYIMESKANSGTMTSLNEALELGIDVKVLPYDIFNEHGYNNNHLLSEGAICIDKEEIAF